MNMAPWGLIHSKSWIRAGAPPCKGWKWASPHGLFGSWLPELRRGWVSKGSVSLLMGLGGLNSVFKRGWVNGPAGMPGCAGADFVYEPASSMPAGGCLLIDVPAAQADGPARAYQGLLLAMYGVDRRQLGSGGASKRAAGVRACARAWGWAGRAHRGFRWVFFVGT